MFDASGIEYDGAWTASDAFTVGTTKILSSGGNYDRGTLMEQLGLTTHDRFFAWSDFDGDIDAGTTRDLIGMTFHVSHIYNLTLKNSNPAIGWLIVTAQGSLLLPTADPLIAGEDEIHGGTGEDIVIGDLGTVTQTPGTLKIQSTTNVTRAETTDADNGASDEITGDGGADRIFGGSDGDYINVRKADGTSIDGQTGDDVILGDNGYAVLDPANGNRPIRLVTNYPSEGGKDFIYANEGRKIVFGGADEDEIRAGGDEISDILVGDEGFAQFDINNGELP